MKTACIKGKKCYFEAMHNDKTPNDSKNINILNMKYD